MDKMFEMFGPIFEKSVNFGRIFEKSVNFEHFVNGRWTHYKNNFLSLELAMGSDMKTQKM